MAKRAILCPLLLNNTVEQKFNTSHKCKPRIYFKLSSSHIKKSKKKYMNLILMVYLI